jgi:hypothetical protein
MLMAKLLASVLVFALVGGVSIAPQNKPTIKKHPAQEYRVHVDFWHMQSEAKKYPHALVALKRAQTLWRQAVPLNTMTYSDKKFPVKPRGMIAVRFAELEKEGLLGLWRRESQTIIVDPVKQKDPEKIFATMTHEIGHALGMPHVRNYSEVENAWSGDFLVKNGTANDYIMYPWAFHRTPRVIIQPLEAEIVTGYLKWFVRETEFKKGGTLKLCEYCEK